MTMNKLNIHLSKEEQQFSVFTFIASVTFMIAVFFLNNTHVISEQFYFPIYIIVGFICIAVTTTISTQNGFIPPSKMSRRQLYISATFWTLSLLNLFRLLSYDGMPQFIVTHSIETSAWFWIIIQVLLASSLLVIYYSNDLVLITHKKWIIYSISTLVSVILFMSLSNSAVHFPKLYESNGGITPIHRLLTYIVCLFYFGTIVILHKRYRSVKMYSYLIIINALIMFILGQLLVTFSNYHHDFINLLGHIYFLIGTLFMLKGIYLTTIAGPMNQQRRVEKALYTNEKKLSVIVETIPSSIIIVNREGDLTFINPAFESLIGLKKEDILQKNVADPFWKISKLDGTPILSSQFIYEPILTTKTAIMNKHCFLERSDGHKLVLSVNAAPIFDDNYEIINIIYSLNDITAYWQAQNKINELAYYDELTHLPNRQLFINKVRQAIKNQNLGKNIVILYINLDRFENVNHSLGHDIGDLFLQTIAKRLNSLTNDQISVAKVSAAFAVLIEGIHEKHADQYAEDILSTIQEPIVAKGFTFHITASIGIAIYPNHGTDVDTLVKNASTALYKAKEVGNTFKTFDQEMTKEAYEQIMIESELRNAIERNELTLHYQPQINVLSGEIVGVEALIRWVHPQRGYISPATFIPIAEKTGLIVPLGQWVLETTCQQLKKWHNKGFDTLKASVNLSMRQFFQHNLRDTVQQALNKSQLDPYFLELEVTESVTIDIDRALNVLDDLKKIGVQIAIDDFGTGYSSLSHIKNFPVDKLKIDKSFICDITNNPKDAAIVSSITTMAQQLNLKVIAEGVETEEQVKYLDKLRCHTIQGYYYSKPITAASFEDLLKPQVS
ncbi:EAL domain-containing protein [Cytobacillus sp. Hm23]